MKPKTLEGLIQYRDQKRPPGDFLTAVLENDLLEAVRLADPENAEDLAEIVVWCVWELPLSSWGSPIKVAAWLPCEPGEIPY